MGYSIMCPFKDEDTKNQMFSFLKKNYRTYQQISNSTIEDEISEPTDILSYGPETDIPVSGFNYHCCEFDREYAFQLCYWMSLMSGHIKDVDVDGVIYHNCHYVIYDGNEDIPIYIGKGFKMYGAVIVNPFGFKPIWKTKFFLLNFRIKKADKIIKKELERLTDIFYKETYKN